MDTYTRNRLFIENEYLIKRVMRCNYRLLQALHLERDDVYQELAVAALNAINTFDPLRSDDIRAHIWMKLQYAILDIRDRYRPYGMSTAAQPWMHSCSLELLEEMDYPPPDPAHNMDDSIGDRRLRQAMARLEPQERAVVILYLDGGSPMKKAQRHEFTSALEKLREFYLTNKLVMGGAV